LSTDTRIGAGNNQRIEKYIKAYETFGNAAKEGALKVVLKSGLQAADGNEVKSTEKGLL
jgi:hypothetical protein